MDFIFASMEFWSNDSGSRAIPAERKGIMKSGKGLTPKQLVERFRKEGLEIEDYKKEVGFFVAGYKFGWNEAIDRMAEFMPSDSAYLLAIFNEKFPSLTP